MLEKSALELKELEHCSFNNWYDLFEKISIKSFRLQIPEHIVDYLKEELIILPKECEITKGDHETPDPDDIIGEEGDFDDEDTEQSEVPEFQVRSLDYPTIHDCITIPLSGVQQIYVKNSVKTQWISIYQNQLALSKGFDLDYSMSIAESK